MRVWYCAVIILALASVVVLGQQNAGDDCNQRKTCTACIRTPGCIWCNIEDAQKTKDTNSRCIHKSQVPSKGSQWCKYGKIENHTSKLHVIDNREFSSVKANTAKVVQLRPQIVNLKLRKGEEYHLSMTYKRARDYPMDLYFLVDLSISMDPFRNSLSSLGNAIANELKDLTSDFQLGFGSFIDKKNYPSTVLYKNEKKAESYAFRHRLSLTNTTKEFKKIGEAGPAVGLNDDPESGFDGIMQSIVCGEKIGWRSKARHLLIHASDALPHIAGDGKIGGLPEPNDEQCHLDESGYYTHAELQDFPSVGQINRQAANNSVNIMFVVFGRDHEEVYKGITNVIKGSTVRTVHQNFDNILQVIRQEYKNLVESVTMTSQTSSSVIDVKILSKCLNKNGKLQDLHKCDDIHLDDTIEFVAKIRATSCPEREEDWRQTIEFRPQGINENLIVNVELLCGCECSKVKPENTDDSICGSHGKRDCGVCSCDKGYDGTNCQMTKDGDEVNPNESCRRSVDGVLCGGHGQCEDGKCTCTYGWDGEACEINIDTSGCRPPGKNPAICSNAGKCKDGRCVCDKKMKRHGEFCEECPTCPSQKCDEFKDCVECIVHKTGSIHAESPNCDGCDKHNIEKVDAIKKNADEKNSEEHFCQIPASDGSTFVFTYYFNGQNFHVKAEKDKKYPIIDDYVAVTLGVMALTLLLGLLTILAWKVVTHLHDKREFQKFEKERANPKWGQAQNPLYVDAVTTFQNPTFSSLRQEDQF